MTILWGVKSHRRTRYWLKRKRRVHDLKYKYNRLHKPWY